ncbi:ArnT family glycosyltransferase [Teredinibacter waterburyi]|uniref:ArnT family glycosyltransferase n=1 Tax=Teredinibacter waterburyi TaxID=1500538 RepID=UPI00165FB0C6|nr:glycosyltransferase family 39 protein [Teredinibacter waterburyi]
MDTTESRYAEISRIMLESGDWVTPQFSAGTPFWGKPPLLFWLTAGSFKILGVNEFAARISAWLLSVLVLFLTYRAAVSLSIGAPLKPVLVLASTAIFFISSGAVMTEACLLASVTLCLVSFLEAIKTHSKAYWRYLFFVGLGMGMLAKGPIAIVMVATPVFLWAVISRGFLSLWRSFPWVIGSAIAISIFLPWYILAEQKTPGFLDYFIVGEHFNRFLTPGWQGDLYGTAHNRPYGTIWVLWVLAVFPWSFVFLALLFKRGISKNRLLTQMRDAKKNMDSADLLLLAWTVTPLLFFTFAGNILATYVITGVPSFALLISRKKSNL